MMAHFEYHNNSFTTNILTLTPIAQQAAIDRGEGVEGQNNWDTLTLEEQYIMRCFNMFTRLDTVIEQLNHISIYLSRYHGHKDHSTHNINPLSYTQYHVEVYVHKIHTVLELMRLMVNRVYEFNIPDKDCTWEKLKAFPGVKGSAIEKILNSYFKAFKGIIDSRHLNTHRGWFEDPEMERLSQPLFLLNKSEEYGLEIPEFSDRDVKNFIYSRVHKFRRKRSKEMLDTNKTVYSFVNSFYNELDKIFKTHLNEIRLKTV